VDEVPNAPVPPPKGVPNDLLNISLAGPHRASLWRRTARDTGQALLLQTDGVSLNLKLSDQHAAACEDLNATENKHVKVPHVPDINAVKVPDINAVKVPDINAVKVHKVPDINAVKVPDINAVKAHKVPDIIQ